MCPMKMAVVRAVSQLVGPCFSWSSRSNLKFKAELLDLVGFSSPMTGTWRTRFGLDCEIHQYSKRNKEKVGTKARPHECAFHNKSPNPLYLSLYWPTKFARFESVSYMWLPLQSFNLLSCIAHRQVGRSPSWHRFRKMHVALLQIATRSRISLLIEH